MTTLMSAGLAGSFLSYIDPDLDQIAANLEDPAAQPPYTPTWGIDPSVTHVVTATYPHRDEAMATTTQTTTVQFLDDNYLDCTVNTTGQVTPTLAMAYQESFGFMDLTDGRMTITNDDSSVQTSAPVQFSVPLDAAVLGTMRQTQLNSYACDLGDDGQATWRPLSGGEALNEVNRRYADDFDQPWFGTTQQIFLTFYTGMSTIISVDGQLVDDAGQTAPDDAFVQFSSCDANTMPGCLREEYQLDSLVLNVDTRGTVNGYWDWSSGLASFQTGLTYAERIFYGLVRLIASKWKTVELMGIEMSARNAPYRLNEVDDPFEVRSVFNDNIEYDYLTTNPQAMTAEAAAEASSAEANASVSSTVSKYSGGIALVMIFVVAVFIWVPYFSDIQGEPNIQRDIALANAIAATIVLGVQVLIDATVIAVEYFVGTSTTIAGGIVALVVFVLIYIIVAAISGDWNPLNTNQELAKLILNVNVLAQIPDNGINTGPLNMQVDSSGSPANGVVAGDWFNITTTISTTLQLNPTTQEEAGYKNKDVGSSDDVAKSWAYARWSKMPENSASYPTYLEYYSITNTLPLFGASDSSANTHCYANGQVVGDSGVFTGTEKECLNDVSMAFKPADAGRNIAVPFETTVEENLRYQKCWWDVIGYTCSYDMNYTTGPDDPPMQSFTIDVLPDTLTNLMGWNAYNPVSDTASLDFNSDLDNDGLPNSQETAECTNGLPPGATSTCPDNPDSDGDGLSDGWEADNSEILGTDATLADTDGDGLDDGYEIRLGTSVPISDTDRDGLLDGEEACRYVDGQFVGGWPLPRLGYQRVCSDPLKGDYDGDHLLDSHEKRAGLSPYAPNSAPWLWLTTSPAVLYSGGMVSVLGANDPLTVTLYVNNVLTTTIDQPLTLDYATDVLTTPSVVSQIGSSGYTPSEPGGTASGLSWNLSANPLYAVEAMTSTLLTGADPALTTSQVTTLTATLVYSDAVAGETRTLSQTIPVLVDLDQPTSTIATPADGQAINGTAYGVSGTATDPTSWPMNIEARVSGGGYDTGWQTASGASAWNWTWTPLPNDGVYTIQSRATDYVDNVQSSPTSSSVVVDNTAPGASFSNISDGDALQTDGNTVTIQGSATDLLSGAAQVAGLQTVQLSIDGRPWTNIDEYLSAPHPATATWQYSWTVNDAAYGSHSLRVRAVDALGQIGDATEIGVIIDTLPPTDIWSNYQPYLPAGQAVELLGHADDRGNVPLPARPQALENTLDAVLSSTVRLMPDVYSDTVGMTVAWLGDVDGDARADLAVGMPAASVNGNANAGRVSIVYGQPGGWPVPPQSVALPDATTSFVGSAANAQLGQIIGPAGDVNSDGLSDILLGDPTNNRVYLVYGSTGGIGQDFNLTSLATGQNGHLGKVFTASDGQIGTWASAAGDVNGDGFDDLLIGATGLSGGAAATYLIRGGTATNSASVIDVASAALETFQMDGGGALATGVGDVNDDQYDDFVVADPNNSFGGGAAVYLFLGPPAWRQPGETGPLNPATHADASFPGSAGVGAQVVALGDVNGDALPDFAYSDDTTPRVVYGRTGGWTTGMSPSVTFSGSTAFDAFIAAPGDVNADGVNDVLLGSSSGGGTAFLYHGRSDLATQPAGAGRDQRHLRGGLRALCGRRRPELRPLIRPAGGAGG